jgi:hypothetical protein
MIDWNDPDYTSAGNQFQAYISSVSVKCADPTPVGNMSSYVYGSNSSTSTPNVTLSSASTLLEGAASTPSISTSLAKKIGIIAAVVLLVLIISALLVRACLQRRRRKARASETTAPGFGGQTYSSLKDSTVNLADTHVPDLDYSGNQYPPAPPAYGGQQSSPQYGGGRPPYGSQQQQFRRY